MVASPELSKLGAAIHAGVVALGGNERPTRDAIVTYCADVVGLNKAEIKAYIQDVERDNVGKSAADILQAVRDKQAILELINEATGQLQKSRPDLALLSGLLTADRAGSGSVAPVAELIKDGLPDPPHGLQLASLKQLTKYTGGIIGMWALAGEPKVGKSTLAWQIGIDVGRHTPVIYYDFENGFATVMDRTRSIYQGNLSAIKDAMARIYYRDNIRTLDRDLNSVPAPALVIIDSVQKLPGSVEFRRQGIDRWVHRLEALKKRGYSVLLVSEVGRAFYGDEAYVGAFKESGEIEYSADMGAHLIPESGELVSLNIVANRHRKHKGVASMLQRKHDWWFKELGNGAQESEEVD